VYRCVAEVLSTRRRSPWINLRHSLRVGAWNVLSRREDDHLSLYSSELKRLDIGIAARSEVRRQDCSESMVSGDIDDWSGHSDGYHAQGVTAAVSNKLTPMTIQAIPVNERVMRRTHHALGVISLVSRYVTTETSDFTVKDAFYAMFDSVLEQFLRRDTLLILGNFNASTGTDRDSYETCVGHRGSGTVNQNST